MADKNVLVRRLALAVGAIIVVVALVVAYLLWCIPKTTVIVLRHAEKDTTSTEVDQLVPLNADGVARANTLAQVAARAGVTAIYVNQNLRTQQTAEPLATSLPITPIQINSANMDDLINDIQASKNRGGVIVVVGHNNTVPTIVDRLGGGTVTVDEQFDNLFILTLNRWGTTQIIQATYGAPR